MVLSLPKCGCSARSTESRVFTCPECITAANRFWDGERVAQHELFDDLDTPGSVSELARSRSELTHISEVLRPYIEDDGLPF